MLDLSEVAPYIHNMTTATNKGSKGGRYNRKGSFFVLNETTGFTMGEQYYKAETAEANRAYWAGRGVVARVIDKPEYDRLAEEARKAGRRFG